VKPWEMPEVNGHRYDKDYLERREFLPTPADNLLDRIRAKRPVKKSDISCSPKRRTSIHEKAFTYRLGYQMAVGCLVQGDEHSRFTGSSLNKKKRRAKKNTAAQEIPFPVSEEIVSGDGSAGALSDLQSDPVNKSLYHVRVSNASRRNKNGFHVISKRSAAKIRDKATAFFRATRKQKIFCTLTFIQHCTDRKAVEILNKFLTVVRGESENFQYLWVAERQPESGYIHFHLILNRRLEIRRFNSLWVQQQYNAGLRYGFITPEEIASRVADETIHEILNPVDVKKIHTIGRLSYYLTKYITKGNNGDASGGFECAAWHCSRGVSRIFTASVVSRSTFAATESFINTRVNKETGEVFTGIPRENGDPNAGRLYLVRWIVNKPYFLQFMREMETLNNWILGGLHMGESEMESLLITNEKFRIELLNNLN
jgi:hypothetical protein